MTVYKEDPINVVQSAPRQYRLTGYEASDNWDDAYINFSGYFGPHSPHVYAAAPRLYAAAKALEEMGWFDRHKFLDAEMNAAMVAMHDAIKLAEGPLPSIEDDADDPA